jgi:hypothetical protein
MIAVDSLKDQMSTIREAILGYAKPPVNGQSDLTQSPDGELFTVVDVYQFQGKRYADAGLIVRVTDDRIIIERDMNNKPRVDALVQAGIPRDKIVLAYAGEPVPEAV